MIAGNCWPWPKGFRPYLWPSVWGQNLMLSQQKSGVTHFVYLHNKLTSNYWSPHFGHVRVVSRWKSPKGTTPSGLLFVQQRKRLGPNQANFSNFISKCFFVHFLWIYSTIKLLMSIRTNGTVFVTSRERIRKMLDYFNK